MEALSKETITVLSIYSTSIEENIPDILKKTAVFFQCLKGQS